MYVKCNPNVLFLSTQFSLVPLRMYSCIVYTVCKLFYEYQFDFGVTLSLVLLTIIENSDVPQGMARYISHTAIYWTSSAVSRAYGMQDPGLGLCSIWYVLDSAHAISVRPAYQKVLGCYCSFQSPERFGGFTTTQGGHSVHLYSVSWPKASHTQWTFGPKGRF